MTDDALRARKLARVCDACYAAQVKEPCPHTDDALRERAEKAFVGWNVTVLDRREGGDDYIPNKMETFIAGYAAGAAEARKESDQAFKDGRAMGYAAGAGDYVAARRPLIEALRHAMVCDFPEEIRFRCEGCRKAEAALRAAREENGACDCSCHGPLSATCVGCWQAHGAPAQAEEDPDLDWMIATDALREQLLADARRPLVEALEWARLEICEQVCAVGYCSCVGERLGGSRDECDHHGKIDEALRAAGEGEKL